MVLMDLATAIIAPTASLRHIVDTLQAAGIEVCIWSALDRRATRGALMLHGILEIFDDVYHMDRLKALDTYDAFQGAQWIDVDALRRPADLLKRLGVPDTRVPVWLGWLEPQNAVE